MRDLRAVKQLKPPSPASRNDPNRKLSTPNRQQIQSQNRSQIESELGLVGDVPFQQKMADEFKVQFDAKQQEARDEYNKTMKKWNEKQNQPAPENINNFKIMKQSMLNLQEQIKKQEKAIHIQRVTYALTDLKTQPALKFFVLCNDPFDFFLEIQKRKEMEKANAEKNANRQPGDGPMGLQKQKRIGDSGKKKKNMIADEDKDSLETDSDVEFE